MLGEAISMLVPQVVGFRLTGALPEGATATDLVLTVTQILRETGVVGKFVEYFGHGLDGAAARRPRDDREHVARVRRDVRLLPRRRRDAALPAADRPHAASRSRSSRPTARRTCSGTTPTSRPTYSQIVELDLSTVEPSLAGPRRPQDRVPLREAKEAFLEALPTLRRRLRQRRRRGRRRDASRPATRSRRAAPGSEPDAGAARSRTGPRVVLADSRPWR